MSVLFFGILIAGSILAWHPSPTQSASPAPLAGYLWSDTIGWIDLNCNNTSSCGTNSFGMSMASDGTISGYAWSDNIGWVSANASDVAGCPSGVCAPKISGNSVSGWFRVISGGTSQSGDWDGFISLSGTGYEATFNSITGKLSGYAWGDVNLGWVSFAHSGVAINDTAYIVASCVSQNLCVGNDYSYQNAYCQTSVVKSCTGTCTPSGCSEDLTPPEGSLQAQPSVIRLGGVVKVLWSSTDATSCIVEGDNGDSWTGTSSPIGGRTSSAITDTTTYTLNCTGDGGSAPEQTVRIDIAPAWKEL